jgi:MinD-like ATPase involved in chromosome partitioning or flagellar assembly
VWITSTFITATVGTASNTPIKPKISPPAINDTTLAYLDDADSILSIVTPDRNSIRTARLAGQAFVAAGMSPQKMMLIMNRAGSPGIKPEQMGTELGRLPDVAIPDDPQLVKATTAEGVPFVLAQPKAKASLQIAGIAERLMAPPDQVAARPPVAPALAKSPA